MKKIILILSFLLSLASCEKVRNTSYQSTNISILMDNNVNFFSPKNIQFNPDKDTLLICNNIHLNDLVDILETYHTGQNSKKKIL